MKQCLEFQGTFYESTALVSEKLGVSNITLSRWFKRCFAATDQARSQKLLCERRSAKPGWPVGNKRKAAVASTLRL